jgi:ABC-2 type transport system ATP-binding protein
MTNRDHGEVMIEVDHLTRHYGPAPALQEISFRAYRGEIVGFLGPNGAGKTTTMRILTGYLPPTSGRAFVAGHDVVTDSMAARRSVGYLPETTPLYPEMTVWNYLDFMARLHGVRDRDTAIERAMSRVDLNDRADQQIGRLSKGLRQRVGIAQAVLHDPPVIILDEPTIGLDPRQIREVRSLIEELRGDHTVILSTHILPEAQQVCDRVLIINRGRLVAEDTPDHLTSRLSGGQRVRLSTAPEIAAAGVRAALGAVTGVAEVSDVGPGIYHVDLEAGLDARPELARAVVAQNWPLLELVPVGMSLEDIFLELTRDAVDDGVDVDSYDEVVSLGEGDLAADDNQDEEVNLDG